MRRMLCAVIAAVIAACDAGSAIAQEQTIRFAYLAVVDLLPYYVADKKGYFKDVGLSVEPIQMTGGPAIASAVMSGSADVGYAGTVPIISARIQKLPLKFFSAIALDQGPDHHMNVFVGSPKLGIASVNDLRGKVVAMNTQGGQCDLVMRNSLADAAVALDQVKVTNIPFPQTQAALALGNIAAGCTAEPFLTGMKRAGMTNIVMKGLVRGDRLNQPQLHTGIFAKEDWLGTNRNAARKFRDSLDKAIQSMKINEHEARQILSEYTKLPPDIVKEVTLALQTIDLKPEQLQPVIDATVETKLFDTRVNASDLLYQF